eukprot:gb/GECG01016303.1/.p1 GENE.gb/GECG01016303.1/~~gb/GECG01016303.1/.p1  ORF type:complete len:1171 (+),score=165.43 gb/GECG01016303.1/:1-3513(+)
MSFLPSLQDTDEVLSSWTTRERIQQETWHEAEKIREEQRQTTQNSSGDRTRPLSNRLASSEGSKDGVVDEKAKKRLIDEWYRHYVHNFSRPRRTDNFLNEFSRSDGRFHQLRDSKFHQWIQYAKSKDQYFVENAVAEQEYHRKQKEEEKRKLDEKEKQEREQFQRTARPEDRLYGEWKRKNIVERLTGKHHSEAAKPTRGFLRSSEKKTEFDVREDHRQHGLTPRPPPRRKKVKGSSDTGSSSSKSRSMDVPNWLVKRKEYSKALGEVVTRDIQAIKNALRSPMSYRTDEEQTLLTKWLKEQGPPFTELRSTYRSRLSNTIMLKHLSPDSLVHNELKNPSSEEPNEEATDPKDEESLYFVLQGYILVVEGTCIDVLRPGDSFGDEGWYSTLKDGVNRREKRVRSTLTSGIDEARDAIEAGVKAFKSKISSIVNRRASFGITPRSDRGLFGGFFGDLSPRNADSSKTPNTLSLRTPLDTEDKMFRLLKDGSAGQRILLFPAPSLGNQITFSVAEKLLQLVQPNDLSLRFSMDPRQFSNGLRGHALAEEIAEKLVLTTKLQSLIEETDLTSSTGVDVGRLRLSDYTRTIDIEKSRESRELASWLHASVPVLGGVNIHKVLSVAKGAEIQSFDEGELIYAQYSSADTLCFLREGLAESVCRVGVKFSYRVPSTQRAKQPHTKDDKFHTRHLSQLRDVYVKVRRIHEGECFGEEAVLSLLPEPVVLKSFITQASNRRVDLVYDDPERVYFATKSNAEERAGEYIEPLQLDMYIKEHATALKQQPLKSNERTAEQGEELEKDDESVLLQLRRCVQQIQSHRKYSRPSPREKPSTVARPHNVIAVRPCEVIFIKKEYLNHLAYHEKEILFKLFRAALLHPTEEEVAYEQISNLNRICEDRQVLVSHLGHRYSSRVYEDDTTERALNASPSKSRKGVTNYARISAAARKQTTQQYASAEDPSIPQSLKSNTGCQEPLAQGGFVSRRLLTSFPISFHARSNSEYVSAVKGATMGKATSEADPQESGVPSAEARSRAGQTGQDPVIPSLQLDKLSQGKDEKVVGPKFVAKAIASDRSRIGSSNSRRTTMWDPVYDAEEDDVLYALSSAPYSSPRYGGEELNYFDSDRLHEELQCNLSNFPSTFDNVVQKLEGASDKELLQMLSEAASRSPRMTGTSFRL